jgi:hypothetical protein
MACRCLGVGPRTRDYRILIWDQLMTLLGQILFNRGPAVVSLWCGKNFY